MEKYNKDITAVIPVREGSTRLKNKNVAPFAGTNSVSYTHLTLPTNSRV